MITVRTIPHGEQRYETVGDWIVTPEGDIHVLVSEVGDLDAEFLVAIHELIEAWAFAKRGGTQQAADEFDMGHPELDEPGCDPRCPYHAEHEAAEVVERVACAAIGKDWHEYEAVFERLHEV